MFVKLNTDDNSHNNMGKVNFGGILWNSASQWLIGFMEACGINYSLAVELHVIYNGLKIVW
uniref:RNase H type-1 domain-containing protein n=1 Tax=Cajanus cajan TaxID=3821 RepID=A0A151QRK1_CAJCA|nr:hypothetical protein KK1_046263 [Cajanus cajan]